MSEMGGTTEGGVESRGPRLVVSHRGRREKPAGDSASAVDPERKRIILDALREVAAESGIEEGGASEEEILRAAHEIADGLGPGADKPGAEHSERLVLNFRSATTVEIGSIEALRDGLDAVLNFYGKTVVRIGKQ